MKSYERIGKHPEQGEEEFRCGHCSRWVSISEYMGTHHRNHCPSCLWSRHVDSEKAGDRKALCGAGMEPVGLTFKQAGIDRYGRPRQGELMLVHHCTNESCGKISINRIAADDNPEVLMDVFRESQTMDDDLREVIAERDIVLLTEDVESQVRTQLFGKS